MEGSLGAGKRGLMDLFLFPFHFVTLLSSLSFFFYLKEICSLIVPFNPILSLELCEQLSQKCVLARWEGSSGALFCWNLFVLSL